nr:transposase, mutator type [Tanacetum cinerariifolium]
MSMKHMICYAGCFTKSLDNKYVHGDFDFLDCIDIDEFSVHDVNEMVKKLGFSGRNIMYYSFLKPDMNLDTGFTRHEDGESSQPKTTTDTTQTEFAIDFYTTCDPLIGQDFHPFFTLYSAPMDAINTPTTKADCVGKGKGIALDDGQVDVSEDVDWNEAAEDENRDWDDSDSDGYNSESDGLVDEENELVDVEVDMDGFDRAKANTMGNEGTTEFNADEDFDIRIEVVDNDEFESASDEERIDKIRTRKLKQLMKQNQINEGVFIRELFLKKNDKVRLRTECRGTILVFHANSKVRSSQVVRPSQIVGPSQGSQTKRTKGKIATSKGIESPLSQ